MKRIVVSAVLAMVAALGVPAQDAAGGGASATFSSPSEIQQRLQLAISSEEYPVTPGDVYRLTYRQADTPVTVDLLVESNCSINMRVFGALDATGMTFPVVKSAVEKAVTAAYPRSMPSLVIYSLGMFQVHLRGETPQSQSVVAWGLARLSEIVENRRNPTASLRNIRIVSRNGKERSCDLFKAYRLGGAGEDPYVKPGDTIVLSKTERSVEIAGEVWRPGTYELLAGEQLRDLVESYGGGLTERANVSRVRIQRTTGGRAQVLYVSFVDGYPRDMLIGNTDVVTVPSVTEVLPFVTFEGAVIQPSPAAGTTAGTPAERDAGVTSDYQRLIHRFMEGEMLSDAARAVRSSIAPLADLSSASVEREGTSGSIPVNLQELLTNSVSSADMILKANDRVVIPFLRYSVYVSGAVARPGTYPYSPGRAHSYYVTLAGGSTQDAPDRVVITDVHGTVRDKNAFIQPEDTVQLLPADVMVYGAVFAPGTFSYREGLPISYVILQRCICL